MEARAVTHEAIVQSAVHSAERAEELGMGRDKIILSAKVSNVQDLIVVYQMLGGAVRPRVASGADRSGHGVERHRCLDVPALAVLLQQGIGDTIRISLTPEPGGDRTQEVVVGQEILQTMGFRSFIPW